MARIDANEFQDDFDIRNIIQKFLQKIKLFLILIFIGGVLLASYTVFQQLTTVDASLYFNDPSLVYIMNSDSTKMVVSVKTGIPLESLPAIEIQTNASNKALFTISVSGLSNEKSISLANKWAEIIIEQAKEIQKTNANQQINKARETIQLADNKLDEYLQKHALNSLSWADLINLTGTLNGTNQIIIETNYFPPQIPSTVRIELSDLVREKINAELIYSHITATNYDILYSLDNNTNYFIVSQAQAPRLEIKSILINFIIGSLVIAILAFVYILLADWWKNQPMDKINKRGK